MTMTRVVAVVLAGGRSRRFGSDKLAASVEGRPVLDRAIEAVAAVADEVVVVVAPGDDRPLPPGSRRVEDPAPFEGPLVGLAAGLGAEPRDPTTTADVALVVGGDMPALRPAVLRLLIAVVREGAAGAVLHDGTTGRPLPAAYRLETAAAATRRLLDTGERRLRALPHALDATVIAVGDWRRLDPDAATLLDVDSPADLDRATRSPGGPGGRGSTPGG
jgi:molybdenum cofactor guanylyltransferase